MSFDANQGWQTQIYGTGGTIMSLNRRLFVIRRLKNHLNNSSLLKLVDGIFTSKIRYGLQLLGKVRLQDSDPINKDFENIQKVQNKLIRLLTNTKLIDKVSTSSLLQKTNMMSVNQINGQIKIQEIWKSINIEKYPIKTNFVIRNNEVALTRACSAGYLQESKLSCASKKTFLNNAIP